MKYLKLLPIIALAASCTTTSGPRYEASRVIERMDGHDETPKFAVGGNLMSEEGQNAIYAHTMTMNGDARPEACLKASTIGAKSEMIKYIKDAITTSGQLNETNAVDDPGYESLTAFLSQGKLSGVQVVQNYWEKREESDTSGERVLRLKCAVKVAIKKSILEKQLREAMTNAPTGNPEIRQKLLEAQKQFIDGLGENEQAH